MHTKLLLLLLIIHAIGNAQTASIDVYKTDSFASWVGGNDTRSYWVTKNLYEYEEEELKRPRITASNTRMKPVPWWNIDSCFRAWKISDSLRRVKPRQDYGPIFRIDRYIPGSIKYKTRWRTIRGKNETRHITRTRYIKGKRAKADAVPRDPCADESRLLRREIEKLKRKLKNNK